MIQSGLRNESCGPETLGLHDINEIRWNDDERALYRLALIRGEGVQSATGPLSVTTGRYTGRSATDKYIVRDSETENTVWWDNHQQISEVHFDILLKDFLKHARGRNLCVQDLYGGADERYRISTRVYVELAWHALFIRHLLRRPDLRELENYMPDMTVINLPSFQADPLRHGCRSGTIIVINLKRNLVLIGGTEYAGEIKKSIFGFLNYFLPEKGIMPMHCSANVGCEGDSALFFGLSGTGKTTLSSDVSRTLIGDDEHGWSNHGIFNFEGGCYAKTIHLSETAEPEIYSTTQRWGSIFENVILDPQTAKPDFDDGSLTENTRIAYPLHYIINASHTGKASHPKNVIMLTADAFGVLPPIARLTPEQAIYHFLSGYTAKVAGTEKGIFGVQATFSTCFGAPFMPRHPIVYGNLLREKISQHKATCWLVNTGWTGGAYGEGYRIPIKATHALLKSVLDSSLAEAQMRIDNHFSFEVPLVAKDIDQSFLSPRETWPSRLAYDEQAQKLVSMFIDNFNKFNDHVDQSIRNAAPKI
ncbi:phosphoenolpyruvate carboxykinase [Candidatus Endowatersipora endosymbiont of Watersipora subatra]|uniref:phosphoenolpyruvate carboxykinase n=1 Tax=Candidatus Endowatersipora endosymbiont of Watersipora subatra TaxID=3077946 RepID=UPI00312C9742